MHYRENMKNTKRSYMHFQKPSRGHPSVLWSTCRPKSFQLFCWFWGLLGQKLCLFAGSDRKSRVISHSAFWDEKLFLFLFFSGKPILIQSVQTSPWVGTSLQVFIIESNLPQSPLTVLGPGRAVITLPPSVETFIYAVPGHSDTWTLYNMFPQL